MIIVLIGPPGSGKGTQGQLLAKKLHLPYISIGDMFRAMIKNNDLDSAVISKYMAQGILIPFALTDKIIKESLLLDQYKDGCILDGYPRNLEQAKFLEKITEHKIKIIYFNINDQMIIKRVLGRFNCDKCGEMYNSYFIKPKIDNVCDICGADKFIYRQDDDKQIIKNRITEYKALTLPLINYYQYHVEVYNVDASKDKYEVEIALDRMLKMI